MLLLLYLIRVSQVVFAELYSTYERFWSSEGFQIYWMTFNRTWVYTLALSNLLQH